MRFHTRMHGPSAAKLWLAGIAASLGCSHATPNSSAKPKSHAALDAGRDAGAAPGIVVEEAPATDAGIGVPCTARGGQCEAGLRCTADFGSQPGVCTRLGCASNDECGAGATCCKLLVGGFSVCLQDECLPATCNAQLP